MKLATAQTPSGIRWGQVSADRFIPFDPNDLDDDVKSEKAVRYRSLRHFISSGESISTLEHLSSRSESSFSVDEVDWLPPVLQPSKILCVGRNYAEHAREQAADVPDQPVIFSKFASSLIGHREAIKIPNVAEKVDYEGELVVVIGKPGRDIPRESAYQHVFGFTCGNDVTSRDWQKGRPGGQWLLGKSIDTFAPVGPWITTVDEIADPNQIRLETHLNGQQMQSGCTDAFLFKIDELISHLSQFFQLNSGDLLFTGTPEGVGIARNPPVLLKPGDQVSVSIEGIGRLENSVLSAIN